MYLCFLYKAKKGRERKEFALRLVELYIEINDKILKEKNGNLDSMLINIVLECSSNMNININNVVYSVYKYIERNQSFFFFTDKLSYLLKKCTDKCEIERFKSLMNLIIEKSSRNKEFKIIEKILLDIKSCRAKIFNEKYVEKELGLCYLNLAKTEDSIIKIDFYNRAITIFESLDEKELMDSTLGELEKAINLSLNNMECFHYNMPDKFLNELSNKDKHINEYLERTSLREIILNLGIAMIIKSTFYKCIVYEPYIDFTKIDRIESKSVFGNWVKRITLCDNRIIQLGDSKKIINRHLAYELHFYTNVNPVMEWIYTNNIIALKEIRRIFKNSQYVDEDIYKYYLQIEKYYSKEHTFEFINMSVILIEKIIRNINKTISGNSIVVQKKNKETQFNINLQEIMKEKKIKEFFGKGFYDYIDYVLINDKGLNLRNNALHGLMKVEDYNLKNTYFLMHIILILVIGDFLK
ncbi:DUF4209 domain-containing protein [Clostridium perfringens]|nr:DUF4209 domain-containing protein [Clostridium perfringens]